MRLMTLAALLTTAVAFNTSSEEIFAMSRPLLTPSPVAVRQRNLASAAWWREHARKATGALRRQFIANAKAALERAREVSP